MQIDAFACTDVGRVRSNNEDCFRLLPELALYVLSDGMGGEAHGEVASEMAVETIAAHCRKAANGHSMPLSGKSRPELSEKTNLLASAVHLANRKIYETALSNSEQRGMGATILSAWLEGQRLSLVHVGDSRAYLLRGGALEQLTSDHSLVAEQVRQGILTPQQAETSNMQNVLTRALGTHEDVEIDADEHVLVHGDTLLLCSDGLTRMVTEPEIASTLLTYPTAQEAAERLVKLANEYGGEDNVTVVVLRISLGSNGWFGRLRRWARGPDKTPGATPPEENH